MSNTDRQPSNVRPITGARGRPTKAQAESRQTAPDPFELDSGKKSYSPDEFYVSSKNEHDHSESFNVKVPDRIKMAIQQFIGDDGLPAYRSTQDFIRDACAHRIHYLVNSYPSQGPVDPMLEQWARMIVTTGRINLVTTIIADRDRAIQATIDDLRAVANEVDGDLRVPVIEAAMELAEDLPDKLAENIWLELKRLGVNRPDPDFEMEVHFDQ